MMGSDGAVTQAEIENVLNQNKDISDKILMPDINNWDVANDALPVICSRNIDQQLKPVNFLVRDWLETDTHGLLVAPTQGFKSFLTIHLAHSIASGGDFLSHDVRASGPVVFIIGEGKGGFMRRLKACFKTHGHNDDIYLIDAQPNISSRIDLLRIGNAVRDIKPALIVVDTFSSLALGVSENDNTDISMVLGQVRDLARSIGACSLVVHHTGKNKEQGARGASAFTANVDFLWELSRIPDTNTTILSCKKMKDAEQPNPVAIDLGVVDIGLPDSDGFPTTSLAVKNFDTNAKPAIKTTKALTMADDVIRAFHNLNTNIVEVNFKDHQGKKVKAFDRKQIKAQLFELGVISLGENDDAETKAVNRAIKGLKTKGKLNEKSGKIWREIEAN